MSQNVNILPIFLFFLTIPSIHWVNILAICDAPSLPTPTMAQHADFINLLIILVINLLIILDKSLDPSDLQMFHLHTGEQEAREKEKEKWQG